MSSHSLIPNDSRLYCAIAVDKYTSEHYPQYDICAIEEATRKMAFGILNKHIKREARDNTIRSSLDVVVRDTDAYIADIEAAIEYGRMLAWRQK